MAINITNWYLTKSFICNALSLRGCNIQTDKTQFKLVRLSTLIVQIFSWSSFASIDMNLSAWNWEGQIPFCIGYWLQYRLQILLKIKHYKKVYKNNNWKNCHHNNKNTINHSEPTILNISLRVWSALFISYGK